MELTFSTYRAGDKIPIAILQFCIAARHELTNEALRNLSNHLDINTEYLRPLYGDYSHAAEKKWLEYAKSKNAVTVIAFDGFTPVGYAFITPCDADIPGFHPYFLPGVGSNPGLHISEVFVNSNYRHKGIGTAILNEIKKRAQSVHIRHLYLACDLNNSHALWAYAKFGFKIYEYEYCLHPGRISRVYRSIITTKKLGINNFVDTHFPELLIETVKATEKENIYMPSVDVNANDLVSVITRAQDPVFVSADQSVAGVLKQVPSNSRIGSISCLCIQDKLATQTPKIKTIFKDICNWAYQEYGRDVILTRSCCVSKLGKYVSYGLDPYYVSMVLRI